ncbi:Hypothetical protein CINCED_3A010329 [Cinara cedri]|nr:Hypothetical protein CINCED_3A010329 [Cinara cedri]
MQTQSPSTSAAAAAAADDVETTRSVVAQLDGSDQRSANDKMATRVHKRKVDDFIFGKVVGEGSFSTVYLAKDKHTGRQYAIKAYEKLHILKERKSDDVRREKDVMNILTNSGSSLFVRLSCTFQDRGRLFFVMSYAKNGDMLSFLNSMDSFDITCTQFYSGEILLALEYLHNLNIQHRDLKPENILLDDNMHIKLTDFGCSKINNLESEMETLNISNPNENNNGKERANSFVGTAQYISPEIFYEIPTSFSSDLWAFGCIVYQMITGYPPFRCRTDYLIFRKIMNLDYSFPDEFHEDAKDLIEKLLVLEPNKRLGTEDAKRYTSIRAHSFYKGLNFDTLLKTKAPLSCPDNNNYYQVPDNLEPGLGPKQLTRLLVCDELYGHSSKNTNTSLPSTSDAAEGQSTTSCEK